MYQHLGDESNKFLVNVGEMEMLCVSPVDKLFLGAYIGLIGTKPIWQDACGLLTYYYRNSPLLV